MTRAAPAGATQGTREARVKPARLATSPWGTLVAVIWAKAVLLGLLWRWRARRTETATRRPECAVAPLATMEPLAPSARLGTLPWGLLGFATPFKRARSAPSSPRRAQVMEVATTRPDIAHVTLVTEVMAPARLVHQGTPQLGQPACVLRLPHVPQARLM